MKLILLFFVFFISCNTIKNNSIQEDCPKKLIIAEKEEVYFNSFLVQGENYVPLKIIERAIKDSISVDNKFTMKEKIELIEAINNIKDLNSLNIDKEVLVEPMSICRKNISDEEFRGLEELFFLTKGVENSKVVKNKIDKDNLIINKYKDSIFLSERVTNEYFDKGSLYKIKKNTYLIDTYEIFIGGGGGQWIYKIQNLLKYNTSGWLKSAISYRSYIKEKGRDFYWNCNYIRTKLNHNKSSIKYMIYYKISLDNSAREEFMEFRIQKDSVTFIPKY